MPINKINSVVINLSLSTFFYKITLEIIQCTEKRFNVFCNFFFKC